MFRVRRRSMLPVCLLMGIILVPAAAGDPGDLVGEGHIEAGLFLVAPALSDILIGPGYTPEAAPWEFSLDVTAYRGTTIEALVTDQLGAGYFVDMAFYDRDHRNVRTTCDITEDSHAVLQQPYGSAELRTRCIVPEGADHVSVFAHVGIALDVAVVVV